MKHYMMNISGFLKPSKNRYKIEKVKFLKLTKSEIEIRKKKAIMTYDFTDDKKGEVIGILEKGEQFYQLVIASTGITFFPEDSTCLFDVNHPNFDFSLVTEFVFENVDTSNVTSMNEMFYGCSSLEKLDLNHFDTGKVEDFGAMFGACSHLKKLSLNHFNTEKAKQIYWMFSSCENLKELNLSNFKISNVEYMYEMFQECHLLSKLDISNFTFDNIILGDENNDRVFIGMPNDAKIIVKSEKERDFILELTEKHRPIEWNNENIIVKENIC